MEYIYILLDGKQTILTPGVISVSDTDALFVSMRSPHQALETDALESIVRKVARRSGIKVYPHKLRHTFATMGINGGMPLHQLQALMGHSKADTTLIYAK